MWTTQAQCSLDPCAVGVLPACSFQCQNIFVDDLPVFCCWCGPVFSDRVPGIAETLFVRIPILRNDGGDAFRACHGHAKARWRPIVKNIKRIVFELESICEGEHRRGECIK